MATPRELAGRPRTSSPRPSRAGRRRRVRRRSAHRGGRIGRPLNAGALACQIIGDLLENADRGLLLSAEPRSDSQFADALVDRELALIAGGMDPLRIELTIAVFAVARDALRAYAEIDALPETPAAVPGASARDGRG